MRNIRSIVAALIVLATATGVASAKQVWESHIYFHNKSDAWVWVTAYTGDHIGFDSRKFVPIPGKAIGAWCVAPGAYDQHGVTAHIYEVRAEVTRNSNCRHPVMLNELRGFPYATTGDFTKNTMTYYIHGSNGRYVYNNTP